MLFGHPASFWEARLGTRRKFIPIRCVDTGIKYASSADAARKLGKPDAASNIWRATKKGTRTALGMRWERI